MALFFDVNNIQIHPVHFILIAFAFVMIMHYIFMVLSKNFIGRLFRLLSFIYFCVYMVISLVLASGAYIVGLPLYCYAFLCIAFIMFLFLMITILPNKNVARFFEIMQRKVR